MTSRPDTEAGPPIGAECEWCGQPQNLYTQPMCADCSKVTPGDRVAAAMARMLKRAAARAAA